MNRQKLNKLSICLKNGEWLITTLLSLWRKNMKQKSETAQEPYIELDGGYACCPICREEVYPTAKIVLCPKCKQLIDFSWLEVKEK